MIHENEDGYITRRGEFKPKRTPESYQASEDLRQRNRTADRLITPLWRFIEDVGDDDPERTDKFFALREKVRNYRANFKD